MKLPYERRNVLNPLDPTSAPSPAPNQWPHEKIRSVALRYIKESATKESEWRFTCLDALPERLGRVVRLEESERAIVSCFIDGQRWCAMTTSRVFGVLHGSQFSCSPLDVRQWRWGDFKHGGRSEAEVATLALANGTHLRIPYETGPAAMGPIYYERFWTVKYPVLTISSPTPHESQPPPTAAST